MASGSEDGSVVLWDATTKNILQRIEAHEGAVLGVDTLADQSLLVSCGIDCNVILWEAVEPDEVVAKVEDLD